VEGHYGTQLVIGKYNQVDKWANFIVGSGTSNANRKNIFTIKNDGRTVLGADPTDAMDAVTKQYVDWKSPNLLKLGNDFTFFDYEWSWNIIATASPDGTMDIPGGIKI
jgi:hypothetical protein